MKIIHLPLALFFAFDCVCCVTKETTTTVTDGKGVTTVTVVKEKSADPAALAFGNQALGTVGAIATNRGK